MVAITSAGDARNGGGVKKKTKPECWTLATARREFERLVERARTEGPQFIGEHGEPQVVAISAEEYRRLKRKQRSPKSLAEFFARSPLAGCDLNLEREPDPGREVDL